MSTTINRRSFLEITAATFGGAKLSPAFALTSDPAEIKKIATYCELCFWRCGMIAHVKNNTVIRVSGNPKDPLSKGRLCPRGAGAPGVLTDVDRLKSPLIRVGKRGQERFRTASWDEALSYIGAKLHKIGAEYGPEAVAMFKHGSGSRFIEHALRSWGAINVAAASYAQCRGPRDAAFTLTFGNSLGSPEPLDIANADCLVLIGSHIGENMHNSQAQSFANFLGRRKPLIVVDPRQSVAASKANYWLPIKPGTDTALLLAWINVILRENLYDHNFVEKYCTGFRELREHVRDATPAWAAEITEIPEADIIETAIIIGKSRPASLIHPGRRTNWYGNDTQRCRSVAILNALLGSWGARGGFFISNSPRIADFPLPPYPKAKKPQADNPKRKYPFADEALSTGIRDATITGNPYHIKAWFAYASNLIFTLPDISKTIDAIDRLDLLVAIDTTPSEICGYADVVLPECTFLERFDELSVTQGNPGHVNIRQPAVPPSYDARPGWKIGKDLAACLGVPQAIPFDDIEQYLSRRIENSGLDYDELKRDGVIISSPKPVFAIDGAPLIFETLSGKVELWSEELREAGFDPAPRFTPPSKAPAGMFRLITGRSPVHTFARTHNNPVLHEMESENSLWINPALGRSLKLENGSRVRLKNQDGATTFPIKVRLTERIRPDCVYMVHGFGHTSTLQRLSHAKGASTAALNSRFATDPIMGATSIHENFIEIIKEQGHEARHDN